MKYLRTLLKLYPEHVVINSIIIDSISTVSIICHEMSKQCIFLVTGLRHIFKFHRKFQIFVLKYQFKSSWRFSSLMCNQRYSMMLSTLFAQSTFSPSFSESNSKMSLMETSFISNHKSKTDSFVFSFFAKVLLRLTKKSNIKMWSGHEKTYNRRKNNKM